MEILGQFTTKTIHKNLIYFKTYFLVRIFGPKMC